MKKLLLLLLLLGCGFALRAQDYGEFILGGRLNYVGGGRVITDVGRKSLGYTLKVTAAPGYFFAKGWCAGINLGYEYVTDSEGRQYTLEGLPFLRYYTPGKSNVHFFVQLESGPGWGQSLMKAGDDGRHFLWNTTLKPGLFMRIKDGWAAEVTLTSLEFKNINIRSGGKRQEFNQWRFEGLSISFGVSLMFGY